MRHHSLLFVSAVALLACPPEKVAVPDAAATTPPARTGKVTLLITGHESGLLVTKAPRLLAQWKAQEKWPDALAFSTGDSFSGAECCSVSQSDALPMMTAIRDMPRDYYSCALRPFCKSSRQTR